MLIFIILKIWHECKPYKIIIQLLIELEIGLFSKFKYLSVLL